jgi:hypothetical protein
MAMPAFQKAFSLEMSHDGFGTLSYSATIWMKTAAAIRV